MNLIVDSSGMLSLLQDHGRPGYASVGVSPSGAFDRSAFRQANHVLGNDAAATALEVTGGGLSVRADADHVVAVTGGVGPLTIDGDPVVHGRALHLQPGQALTLGTITAGLRAYVGVAGGFETSRVLGSASTDLLSGLGPPPVASGDLLKVNARRPLLPQEDVPALLTSGEHVLDVVLGPRHDWFSTTAVRTLLGSAWQVTSTSNRIGVRLEGPPLERIRVDELPSEPCVRGSIQVTGDGSPIIFGPDHPITGGYPVIAVVTDAHFDRLAQVRPGESLRLQRSAS